jgi:hypothetical protein
LGWFLKPGASPQRSSERWAGELGNGAQYRESLKKLAAVALTRL